ncbi:MAG: cell cycle protein [Phototrophicales bacterium]|nr:MAG: cell cycle protein [Phototrophicales bacterium]
MATERTTLTKFSTKAIPNDTIERGLLLAAGLFIFVNLLSLWLQRSPQVLSHWFPIVIWSICAIVGHELLRRYLPNRDPMIFPLVMLMTGWGVVLIDRLAPAFADRQTIWLAVATGALLVVAVLPYPLRWLRMYRYLLLIAGLTLLIGTIILGQNPSGLLGAPRLWLGFRSLFFQPSEALKIILVAFLASYLGEEYPSLRRTSTGLYENPILSPRIAGPTLMMWGLAMATLIWQRDLGTAAIFFLIFLTLIYLASGYTLLLVGGIVLSAIATLVAYNLFDVVQLRVDVWLNPWPEADGRAFQIVQSLMAFASGGIFGQGIGQGSPTFIPVVHSDFVFAAIAEEWGLFGVITVIAMLAMLVMRGMRIGTRRQEQPFMALFAVGLSMLIAIQSLLIMAGVLRLLPLTGVTLPYFSYGGSSLLMSFVTAGLLLRLSVE